MTIEERIEQLAALAAELAAESKKHSRNLAKDASNIHQLAIMVRENNRGNDEAFVEISQSFKQIHESFVQIDETFVKIKENQTRQANSIGAFLESLGGHESRIADLENGR